MISGEFGPNGELLFEIALIATNGDIFSVEVLLDTGFTTGWLAINSQDLEILDWSLVQPGKLMQTARGEESFDIYAGKILIDGQEFDLPVVAGTELPDNLLGLQWLTTKRLVVDFSAGVLTLG
ncbi:aspartyl protease [Oscillatoriales cyanobacterium USR001]|nr:aspartyl protease [Oscillatoriales cyanobacterium USR001]